MREESIRNDETIENKLEERSEKIVVDNSEKMEKLRMI